MGCFGSSLYDPWEWKSNYFRHWYQVGVRLLCYSKSLPFSFILTLIFVFVFLYFQVTAFRDNLLCSPFVSRYMLEFLSAKVIVFFELWINLMSSWNVVWKSLLAFLNLMSLTTAINSSSNVKSSLSCFSGNAMFLVYTFLPFCFLCIQRRTW